MNFMFSSFKLILSKQFPSEGTFRFTSLKAGRHLICLQSSSSQCPLPAGGMLVSSVQPGHRMFLHFPLMQILNDGLWNSSFIMSFLFTVALLQMVRLDIRARERTNNYAKIAATEKLSELQLRVRQLSEQVRQIQREQDYQRVSVCVCVCVSVKAHVLDLFWSSALTCNCKK